MQEIKTIYMYAMAYVECVRLRHKIVYNIALHKHTHTHMHTRIVMYICIRYTTACSVNTLV